MRHNWTDGTGPSEVEQGGAWHAWMPATETHSPVYMHACLCTQNSCNIHSCAVKSSQLAQNHHHAPPSAQKNPIAKDGSIAARGISRGKLQWKLPMSRGSTGICGTTHTAAVHTTHRSLQSVV